MNDEERKEKNLCLNCGLSLTLMDEAGMVHLDEYCDSICLNEHVNRVLDLT